jgi:hypothetical protein
MKGASYPKRSCQESSKTFHNTLGRKFTYVLTIELSRREGCSASTQKIFFGKIFHSAGNVAHAIAQRRPIADARFQFITVVNWPDPGGCAGQNNVARQKR